jgi:hypothetical protein
VPALKQRLDNLGGLVKAVLAVLALLPGVAVLTGLVDIPPSLADLVKALSMFAGVAVLIVILLLSDAIRRARAALVIFLTVAAVIAGGGAALGYRSLAGRHVLVLELGDEVERHVVPLHPSAGIRRIVEPYGGDYAEALLTSVRKERLRQLMEEESGSSVVLMVALMVIAQTLMVGGVLAGGWKLAMRDESDGGPEPAPKAGRRPRPTRSPLRSPRAASRAGPEA